MNKSEAPISLSTWFSGIVGLAAGYPVFGKLSFFSLKAGASRFRNQLGVIVPVLVSLALTCVVFLNVRAAEWKRAQLVFERQSLDITDSLLANLNSYMEVMHSIDSFYLANASVDRNAFHLFTLGLLGRHPGIQALEWIPEIPGKERSFYEDAARGDGFSHFQVSAQDGQKKLVPAPSKDEYFPVFYVEPHEGNEKALGYDLSTNPARLDALNKARDLGKPIATSRLMLVQEKGTQSSVLIFLPVYSTGSVPGDIESRGRNLKGFILGVFRIGDMVTTALRPFNQRDIAIDLLDKTAPSGEQLLFTSRAQPSNDAAIAGGVEKDGLEALFHLHKFDVGGRQWSIVCSPTASYRANPHLWEAWAVLTGGLLFSVMLGAFLLVVLGQSAATESIVVERTGELSRLNMELSRVNKDLEREIVTHKQTEDELHSATERANDMAKQAQAANEAKSDFIANMSHELRTPLNVIIGFTELILDKQCGDLAPLQEEYLGDVVQSARNLFLLINDILDLVKIETGALQLELAEINLPDLLSRSLTILREKALKHNIQLSYEDEGTPATIVADERKLKQIIYNLLANAVKFTPDGGSVGLKTQCSDGLLEVFIQDSGIGMKKEDLQRIFDPFEQVESSRNRRFQGAGVGLYLTKSRVDLHGGTIWAESEGEGKGARFCFVMPTMPLL